MTGYQDVFISYGRADSKVFAKKLHDRLIQKGLEVWFDFEDIPLGVDYQTQINQGIEQTHNFVFIISPHAVNSPYCAKEIELAVNLHKRIIPLMHVEEISRDTWLQRYPHCTDEDWAAYRAKGLHASYPNMHAEISRINWVYFRENIDDFEQSLVRLLEIIERQQTYVHQHTDLLTKALVWERHQKQFQYLLTGSARQSAEGWLKTRWPDKQPPCQPTDLHCEFICESAKTANNGMTQVFLAYAEADAAIAQRVGNTLMRESITLCANTPNIQTNGAIQEECDQGVEKADNVVYLVSAQALQSRDCQQDIDYALSLNKRIIPLLLEANAIETIPAKLQALQFIDFSRQDIASYRRAAAKLLYVLREDAAYYKEHKKLLAKALKWAQQNRNPSILLRGYTLSHAETWLMLAQRRSQHPPTALQEDFIAESLRQPPATSLDVFISYSHTDADFARKLNDALQLQGKTTWFDQESIGAGADFQQAIHQGIETADNFLFVLSPDSINSPSSLDEADYAAKLNKRVIAVLHHPVNPADLPSELTQIQWIDFSRQGGDFYSNFCELIRTLDLDRAHVKSHTKWTQRAIEWTQRDRNEDLLLRGSELVIAQNWLANAEQQAKRPTPTSLQQTFIQASIDLQTRLQQQEEAQHQRQLAQERRARKMAQRTTRRVIIGGLLMAGLSLFAGVQLRESEINEVRALVASAKVDLTRNRDFDAVLHSLHAFHEIVWLRWLLAPTAHLQNDVIDVLRQAVNVKERNRIEVDSVWRVRFSPDGQILATASYDGTMQLWTVQGSELRLLTEMIHEEALSEIQFSPDGQRIAAALQNGDVQIWTTAGQVLTTLGGNDGAITSLSFSPDGQTLATAAVNNTVRLWNLQTNEPLQSSPNEYLGGRVSFSPNGQRLATIHYDGTLYLWDLDGDQPAQRIEHETDIGWVSFSPLNPSSPDDDSGQILATASNDGSVYLWDLQGNPLTKFQAHNATIWEISFSPNGDVLATASADGTVRFWDLQGRELSQLSGYDYEVWSFSFSPNGETLATASGDGMVRLWDTTQTENPILRGHRDAVWKASFSPDGQFLATASADGTIRLWDLQGSELGQLNGHTAAVWDISFSPNGVHLPSGENTPFLVTASEDGAARLWDLQGNELTQLSGHTEGVWGVHISPNGELIATASADGTARLWDLQGREQAHLIGHQKEIWGVRFSPDGQHIATASYDGTARLWDLQGNELTQFMGHEAEVGIVNFSPDGQHLATASYDKTVRLWDLQGNELAQFIGHREKVWGVSFSPDGQFLATASDDKTVRLWDLQGKELTQFTGHKRGVLSVEFSPDGQLLATASADRTVRLWPVETTDQLLARACNRVRTYLETSPEVRERNICDGIGVEQ